MVNFYSILGLPETAHLNEIKAAFRRLAKIYHPDKNPGGQEEFRQVLRAYETLSDPAKKRAYDLKLKYHRHSPHREETKKTKNWSFDEKEMKRRKYYNDHIKKYEKHTGKDPRTTEIKKNYNEFKYILFATPLAVALFLLIVNLATGPGPAQRGTKKMIEAGMEETQALKMGDAPYTDFFGTQRYDTRHNRKLVVKNQSGEDVILCIFSGTNFVRSAFVGDGFFAEIPQLPGGNIKLRYASGKNWKHDTLLADVNLYGAFGKELNYYESAETNADSVNELTLVSGSNEGFKEIDQRTFFKKN